VNRVHGCGYYGVVDRNTEVRQLKAEDDHRQLDSRRILWFIVFADFDFWTLAPTGGAFAFS
jgi:hypothetical protein